MPAVPKPPRVLKASTLPTVLVVGTLMLLAVFGLLSLLDVETTLWYGRRARLQKEAWLESALLLWERDSTLAGRLDADGAFALFADEPAARVTIASRPWGLYELVTAETDSGRVRAARLMGAATESRRGAVLYAADNRQAFTLSGSGDLRGAVWLPENGLLYGQVHGEFYRGRPLADSLVRRSEARLPEVRHGSRAALEALRNEPTTGRYAGGPVSRGFFEPTLYLACDELRGVEARGNVVIVSDFPLTADSTSRLEEVIVVAPAVTFAGGFTGSVQAVVADSATVRSRARLDYPSGIALIPAAIGAVAGAAIRVEDGAEVNGYVLFDSPGEILRETAVKPPAAAVIQQPGAVVRGLLWSGGVAEIHGTVSGSLYAAQLSYFTPQGYYNNLLHNARLYENRAIAYPMWMEGAPRKKTIKWLY